MKNLSIWFKAQSQKTKTKLIFVFVIVIHLIYSFYLMQPSSYLFWQYGPGIYTGRLLGKMTVLLGISFVLAIILSFFIYIWKRKIKSQKTQKTYLDYLAISFLIASLIVFYNLSQMDL